jgi:hypothetical protein
MQDRARMRQLVCRQSAPASSSTSAQGPSHFGRVTDHFSERISSGIPTAHQQKRGPWVGAPFFVGLCSAVSYSPTPWRVQYHRRWRA